VTDERRGVLMQDNLLQKLADKSLTKEELLKKVERNSGLIPILLRGTSSQKAIIRYGCAKVLMDFSAKSPEKLYPYMDFFVNLLDSNYRILTWNAMAIIANLARVDKNKKFDAIFDKYYSFLNDEYMVTVANVVGNSAKIALAKPHLVQKITSELLKVEDIAITPHLTEECRRVITEKAVEAFDVFFDEIEDKAKVVSFVRRQLDSPRNTVKTKAEKFLEKWNRRAE
jgi:2'-5' RNA ligase